MKKINIYLLVFISIIFANLLKSQVVIIEDFEDDNISTPVIWSETMLNTAIASFESFTSGYLSNYCGFGNFNIVNNGDIAIFNCTNLFNIFNNSSNGIVFYAKGNGIWDLYLITSDISPGPNKIPYIRFKLDSIWKAYYFPWTDFGYPFNATNRPAIVPQNIQAIWLYPQSQQKSSTGHIYIDDLGYYTSTGTSSIDFDGDGIQDINDYDADNDGWYNVLELYANSDSLNTNSYPDNYLQIPVNCSYTGVFPIENWTDELSNFEELTGMRNSLITLYHSGWGDTASFYHFDKVPCDFIARQGAIPVYQWPILNTSNVLSPFWTVISDTLFRLKDIIEGKYDNEIQMFANEVKDWKKILFINPVVEYNLGFTTYHAISNFGKDGMHIPPPTQLGILNSNGIANLLMNYCDTVAVDSMNNCYGNPNMPDGPERLKDALLHIRNIFDSIGANNVIWTMQTYPNVENIHGEWSSLSNYYSDSYVDWFSTSAHHGIKNDTLRNLYSVINDLYDTLMNINSSKPILIIEFAVHSDSTGTIDMTNTFNEDFNIFLPDSFPMIKAWTYVNSDNYGEDYEFVSLQIDSNRFIGEINAFKTLAQNTCYTNHPVFQEVAGINIIGTKEFTVKYYPNPNNGAFYIKVNSEIKSGNNIKIYNINGTLLFDNFFYDNTIYINNLNLKKGIYIVNLINEKFSETQKIIVD